ncbi:unnamed protein product [Pleuronectes platessa]|uniref:Uncharacterized protein n=1 Tax=Pleuronectes platessa TaxID=8262 RepID=A0A9N7VE12_PLEPL|nr:unnamed protein product [Pleuronectes platessa]
MGTKWQPIDRPFSTLKSEPGEDLDGGAGVAGMVSVGMPERGGEGDQQEMELEVVQAITVPVFQTREVVHSGGVTRNIQAICKTSVPLMELVLLVLMMERPVQVRLQPGQHPLRCFPHTQHTNMTPM